MNKNLLIILILLVVAGALWYLRGDNGGENYPFTNPELTERYEDEGLGFFVDYPEGFMVNNTEEENVKVLVFSKKDSDPPARLAVSLWRSGPGRYWSRTSVARVSGSSTRDLATS